VNQLILIVLLQTHLVNSLFNLENSRRTQKLLVQSQTDLCKSHRRSTTAPDEADFLVSLETAFLLPILPLPSLLPSLDMSSTFSSIDLSPSRRFALPNELIDQILRDESLSKRDLARCCRADHQFLSSSRPLLYHSIVISVPVLEDEREDTVGYSLDPSSRSLLQTLADYPFLARYIQHLDMRTRHNVSGTHTIDFLELEEAFELALARMPCIESLALADQHFWRRNPVRDLVFERGTQWVGLSVAGSILDQDGDRRNWSDLPNLRNLHVWELAKNPRVDHRIPAGIETLNVEIDIYCRTDLSFEPGSRLKVLRIPASNRHFSPHLAALHHLQHLDIHDFANRQRLPVIGLTLPLTPLVRLRSLTLSVSIWTQSSDAPTLEITTFLASIPPSIVRLDFLSKLPAESIIRLLETGQLSSLRVIGFLRPRKDPVISPLRVDIDYCRQERHVQRVAELCDEKGIMTEFIKAGSVNRSLYVSFPSLSPILRKMLILSFLLTDLKLSRNAPP